jgi:ASC-1-like (ASCH) protein
MKKSYALLFFVASFFLSAQNFDSIQIKKIYDYALAKSKTYSNLENLCKNIGGRLSGSPQAQKAVEWAKQAMIAAGADTVFLQECKVPHWVRGAKEKCILQNEKQTTLKCIALGNSVGTGKNGIKAKIIEVKSFEELEQMGEQNVKGKIVFYNVFFDQTKIKTGNAYREAVIYRGKGASKAAKYGAVACLVRSMTSVADDEPHTGNMNYDTVLSSTKIPALALGYLSADKLHEAVIQNKNVEVYIECYCQKLPDEISYNVIGQITGTEKPNEYILTGGHLDSWDNGQGAHDDGAGVVQSIEVLAAFKHCGIKPKHSIRAVAFMNEENGLAGGTAYAKNAETKNEKHLAALETDAGGFTPRGLDVDTTNGLFKKVVSWKNLFYPYFVDRIEKGGGGADISLLQKAGVPCIGFEPDSQRYFDIHHTAADTFDKVNKRELNLGVGAIGALIYLIDKSE